MFDAYTVKKVLPRLVIAAVLIQLSWDLFTGLMDLVNAIAWGVEGLLYIPFGGRDAIELTEILQGLDWGGAPGTGIFFVAAVGTIGTALGLLGLLSLAATAFLGLAIAFFVLSLRLIVISALLVISPIAIAAWILPNTEKVWKLWWESYSKLLLMYPLILLFIAAGRVFAKVATEITAGSTVGFIITIVAYFGPFFLIPKTFQLAGSTFANLTGMINDRGRGAFDRLRKGRQERVASNLEKVREGTRWTGNALGRRASRTLQTGALLPKGGFNPLRAPSRIRVARDNITAKQRDALKEDEDYKSWMNNDTLNRAAAETGNANQLRDWLRDNGNYASQQDLEKDVQRVETVRRKYGTDALRQRAVIQAIAGGTAFDTAGEAWSAVGRATIGDTAARQALVAEGRSAAMSAGRVDIGGAGFGDTLNYASGFAGDIEGFDPNVAATEHHANVLKSQGPGVLAHASMKPRAVRELMPEMRERVQEAYESGDDNRINRELATMASVYDAMAQNSPQNAEIFADQVLRWDPETGASPMGAGNGVYGPANPGTISGYQSLQERIENARSNPVFVSTRREYQSAQAQQAAAVQALQGAPPPGTAPGQRPQGPPGLGQ